MPRIAASNDLTDMARHPARAGEDSGLHGPGSLPLQDEEWPIAWALADHEVPDSPVPVPQARHDL